MPLKKWELLSSKDISPHKWFPIEMRTYRLPNKKIVNDFSVTTLADVAMIVPITKEKKVVLVKQFKPGINEIQLEFPAGRTEVHHKNLKETAMHELEEETGIKTETSKLHYFACLNGFPTKGSERIFYYFASDLTFNSKQNLDQLEAIEIVQLNFKEMDKQIYSGKIWAATTISGWELAKKHFPKELA